MHVIEKKKKDCRIYDTEYLEKPVLFRLNLTCVSYLNIVFELSIVSVILSFLYVNIISYVEVFPHNII